MSAVFPSPDSATLWPWLALPTAPVPTSFGPCWVQVVPERVNTHTAPTSPLSPGPPTSAVFPSPDSATLQPWSASPVAPVPTSFGPCWVQRPRERVNTHTAPAKLLSPKPPTSAVFPSDDSATRPWLPAPVAPVPTSFGPCWVQVVPERVNTHTAPTPSLFCKPPTMAVFPSPDSATLPPWPAPPRSSAPTAPVPTSFGPCWVQVFPERVNTHTAPTEP